MSKATSLSRLVVLCSLTALAIGAASATSASAAEEPFTSPSVKVCKKVPTGEKGLFTESHCLTSATSGEYAWATPSNGGTQTWYCLLDGTSYTDDLCQHSGAGPFHAVLFKEDFPRVLGNGGLSIATATVSGDKTTVDCKADTFSWQPETGSLDGTAKAILTGCTITEPEHCEIRSKNLLTLGTIDTDEFTGRLLSDRLADFTPESSGIWAEVLITKGSSGTCSLASSTALKIEGSQMCTFATGISTPAEEHELNCIAKESELKLAGNRLTWEGSSVIHFEGKPLWKIL